MILCSRDLDKLKPGTIIVNGYENQKKYFIKTVYYKWLVCDEKGNTFNNNAIWNQKYDSDQIYFPVGVFK